MIFLHRQPTAQQQADALTQLTGCKVEYLEYGDYPFKAILFAGEWSSIEHSTAVNRIGTDTIRVRYSQHEGITVAFCKDHDAVIDAVRYAKQFKREYDCGLLD